MLLFLLEVVNKRSDFTLSRFLNLSNSISIFSPFIYTEHLFFSILSLLWFLLLWHITIRSKQIIIVCFIFIILDTTSNVIITMPFFHTRPTKLKFTFSTTHSWTTWIFFYTLRTVFVRTFFCIALYIHHVFIVTLNFFKPY